MGGRIEKRNSLNHRSMHLGLCKQAVRQSIDGDWAMTVRGSV